jgi:rhodanese-related sulfurtransferase
MPNPFGAPELSVQEVAAKQKAGDKFILLDVREPEEYDVRIHDERVIFLPLSTLAEQQLDAIPEELSDTDQEVVVFCHRGMRSAQVTAWLRQQGWHNVFNMDGGIAAWAHEIDPSVGTY